MVRARLVIRADASAEMGTGHIMRCLALAQAWQDHGGEVTFVIAQAPPALESRIVSEGIAVVRQGSPPGSEEDARETTGVARECGAQWVVVDGYQFGSAYQRLIKEKSLSLLFVDDYGHADHYWADLVLNQNISAREALYVAREPYTRLLLGTRYVLFRREFSKWREWRRETPEIANKILVTLGGSDPDNVTLKIIQALSMADLDMPEVLVVAGSASPHLPELQRAIRNSPISIRLMSNVNDMAGLMAWAEVAITGAGSTCWETAFMGLPAITIILADNQRPVAEKLAVEEVVTNLGWHGHLMQDRIAQEIAELSASPLRRSHQTCQGQKIVDGYGGLTIISRMVEPC